MSMNIVIVHRNFIKAREFVKSIDNPVIINFSDDFSNYSNVVKKRRNELFEDVFSTLAYKIISSEQALLKFLKEQRNIESISFFSVKSYYEEKLYDKIRILNPAFSCQFVTHNYLLDRVNLDRVKDQFTSFRKLYEDYIPFFYTEAVKNSNGSKIDIFLNKYFSSDAPGSYFDTRNGVVGDGFSTRFSDLLAYGACDVRYLYNLVKDYENKIGANKSTYWIFFELMWREFFYWNYQKHKTKFFSINGIKGAIEYPIKKIERTQLIEKLKKDKFCLAAWNELRETGYLSNRIRQIFASRLINDLNIPWWHGAKLFEENLIDYDVFSNYGNWLYLAGVGCDSRGKRYFDLQKQLSVYDPNNEYINQWT